MSTRYDFLTNSEFYTRLQRTSALLSQTGKDLPADEALHLLESAATRLVLAGISVTEES